MNEDESISMTGTSKARNLDELAEYWETHSLADRWDELPDVDFEVRARPRRRIVLATELYAKLEERARIEGLSPETLANLWLAERLLQTN